MLAVLGLSAAMLLAAVAEFYLPPTQGHLRQLLYQELDLSGCSGSGQQRLRQHYRLLRCKPIG
jgi:hypothetical protein